MESGASFRGYNLLNKTEFVAVRAGAIGDDSMVIDEAMLYYVGNLGGRVGIIAHNIGTGQADVVAERGRNPVIWGDTMVWSKGSTRCVGSYPYLICEHELYARKANNDRLITSAAGPEDFEEYDVWGDHIVWVSPGPAQEGGIPYLYRISQGTNSRLSAANSNHPIINDNLIAWGSAPQPQPVGSSGWSLNLYDINTDLITDLIPHRESYLEAHAFIGQWAIAYTVGGARYRLADKGDLYVVDLVGRR